MSTNKAKEFLARRIATPAWALLVLGMLTLCFGSSALSLAFGKGGTSAVVAPGSGTGIGAQTQSSTDKPVAMDTAQPTPQPTVVPTWQLIQTFNGNGTKNTDTFVANSSMWKLAWTCEPSSQYGGTYPVMVAIMKEDGSYADFAAVNTMCKDGNTSGETIERNMDGKYYFSVNSTAAWGLKVEVLK